MNSPSCAIFYYSAEKKTSLKKTKNNFLFAILYLAYFQL